MTNIPTFWLKKLVEYHMPGLITNYHNEIELLEPTLADVYFQSFDKYYKFITLLVLKSHISDNETCV